MRPTLGTAQVASRRTPQCELARAGAGGCRLLFALDLGTTRTLKLAQIRTVGGGGGAKRGGGGGGGCCLCAIKDDATRNLRAPKEAQ